MKAPLILVAALMATTTVFAQQPPAPAGFPVTVHVVYSRSLLTEGVQQIETEIDGQPVELQALSQGVLALGDYPARISTKVRAPSHDPNSYDIYKGYDLLLPDGKTRTYTVIGMGAHP